MPLSSAGGKLEHRRDFAKFAATLALNACNRAPLVQADTIPALVRLTHDTDSEVLREVVQALDSLSQSGAVRNKMRAGSSSASFAHRREKERSAGRSKAQQAAADEEEDARLLLSTTLEMAEFRSPEVVDQIRELIHR